MKIDIVDNFLDVEKCDKIENFFTAPQFPWFLKTNLNNNDSLGNYYFTHVIIYNGKVITPIFEILKPTICFIMDKLGVSFQDMWRVKVNLYPWTHHRIHHSSHIDYESDEPLTTALYYVNNNDGDTVFDESQRMIESKKNRIIFFNGSNLHHSTTPTNANQRCTINFDYRRNL